MNLSELQKKLTAAARLQRPDERVPYAFEKRITALISARTVADRWAAWSRGLWRAAISCVAVALVLGAVSLLLPDAKENNKDLSLDFENTLLASADQPEYSHDAVNNWKVIFATVVIFGAGVITGGLMVNCIQHCTGNGGRGKPAMNADGRVPPNNPPGHPPETGKPRPPETMSKQFIKRLDEELHLTPAQHEAIQKIIVEGQNQIRKVIQDERLEIREVLTPGQQKQFDELVKRLFHRPVFGTNAPVVSPAATNCAEPSTNVP